MKKFKTAIIGAGAMGGAVARGLVQAGFDASDITVANPSDGKLAPLRDLGIKTTADNRAAVMNADLLVIAVKPWVLPAVAAEIAGVIDFAKTQVAVIVAGISGKDIAGMFGIGEISAAQERGALSIVMPNTAMSIRKSMTFIVDVCGKTPLAEEAFSCLGRVMVIEERLLPAATALASCGIAYAMRYVRAAVEGGVELGFRASDAQDIVVATLEGAAGLLADPGAHAESEIDKVTTPGGLTIRGLNAMEAAGFTPAVIAGLKAGR